MASAGDYNTRLIEEYRSTGGNVTGDFAGRPLLLLTTTGAKSGQQRTNPLMYTTDGDRLVVIASKGGADTNPAWYHNLRANPEATVELGEERFSVRATVIEGAERDRIFDQVVEQLPGFGEYQKNTDRLIPVVVLEPQPA